MGVAEFLRNSAWWLLTVVAVAYLLLAAVTAALATRSILQPHRVPASQEPVMDALVQTLGGRVAARQRVALVLRTPSEALTWPAVMWQRRWLALRTSNLEASARMLLRPIDMTVAVSTLALVVLVGALGRLEVVWEPLVTAVAAGAVGATAARHAAYVVGSLPESLRRSRWNPVLQLLGVAAADACTLTTALTVLRRGDDGDLGAELRRSAADLFSVTGPLGDLRDLTVPDGLALLGLLFYAALINALRSPKALERTDDDLRALAVFSILTGDLPAARSWMRQEKARSSLSFAVRARLALAEQRFAETMRLASKFLDFEGEDSSPDRAAQLTLDWLAMDPTTCETRVGLLRHLMAVGISDPVVTWAAATVGDKCPDDVDTLLADGAWAAFPLSRATLLAASGDFPAAYAVTESAPSTSPFEQIARELQLCRLVVDDPALSWDETRSRIESWSRTAFPALTLAAPGVQDRHRLAALVTTLVLKSVLEGFAEDEPWEPVAELAGLARELAQSDEQLSTYELAMTRAAEAGLAAAVARLEGRSRAVGG